MGGIPLYNYLTRHFMCPMIWAGGPLPKGATNLKEGDRRWVKQKEAWKR